MTNLPKGLRLDHGYVQVRIMHQGHVYHKNFGLDSPLARELAEIHLSEKRKEILMGKFGIEKEVPETKFKDVVPLHLKIWCKEKDGEGRPAHSEKSIYERKRVFATVLAPYFGNMLFNLISPLDVERWRERRLETGVLGTSVDREMVPLSSIFADMARDVALERVPKFKLPASNPCQHVEKAKTRVRERIPTDYELKKIKLACTTLGDSDGWEICKLALKSVLSEKDLRKLEIGSTIDLDRSKTGVAVHIPITILQKLNWHNWRRRWTSIRKEAGCQDLQFRDLRKKGGNHLIGKFDTKLVSQYFGHATVKTTEKSYVVLEREKMRPLQEEQERWVEGL